jgi:hypothetical protein
MNNEKLQVGDLIKDKNYYGVIIREWIDKAYTRDTCIDVVWFDAHTSISEQSYYLHWANDHFDKVTNES